MTHLVENNFSDQITLQAFSWAGYVNMVSATIEQTRRVLKAGGLSQPEVAEHLQSSRASISGPGAEM